MATTQSRNISNSKKSMKNLSRYIQNLEKEKSKILKKFENNLSVNQEKKNLYNKLKDPRK